MTDTPANPSAPQSGAGGRGKAIAMLCLTAVLWSTSGFLIKLVDWNPMAITGTRSAIALIPLLIMFGKPRPLKGFVQIAAAVCYAATLMLYVTANKLTTAANAILLQYTAPVYVVALSAWLLKERVRAFDIATVAAVMAGLVLFFFDRIDPRGMLGNALALLSGVTLALMAVFLRMQKDGAPVNSVIWGNILTAAVGLPFAFTSGLPDGRSWIGLAVLGIFQLGLSYALYVKALRHVTALELIMIPIIEPILNPIIVAFMTGETPGPFTVAGGVIVLAGVTANLVVKNMNMRNRTPAA